MITEPGAVASGLGDGLSQPMEKRSVKRPTAAHALQVLCPRMACEARGRPLW